MMIELHRHFWNEWAEAYHDFSEYIAAYQDAQRDFAQCVVAALGNGCKRPKLVLLDVGGGAGNMIAPILNALVEKRGNLKGVTYTLTNNSEQMLNLARTRHHELVKVYPDVTFRFLLADMLDEHLSEKIGQNLVDVVISSWNIEYYPPQVRENLIKQLANLAQVQGVIAFSSTLRLPAGLKLRDVLMPLGRAQVFHALLSGGPGKMRKVISSLKQISQFGTAITSQNFPEKPTLAELEKLVKQTGLYTMVIGYHLYGASAMVIFCKDVAKLMPLPKLPIAQALVGQDGYENHTETVTFWGYFRTLLSRHNS
jgi:hypothetical protein